MTCSCLSPNKWQPIRPCTCTVEERLGRAMRLLDDLTRAAGDSPACPADREFNRAYSVARDFLDANGFHGNAAEDDSEVLE